MRFSFPPLERRVVSWSVRKHNKTVFIEQVNILPIGGGLWLPVRNLTKTLRNLEARLAIAEKQYEVLKHAVQFERDAVEKEINRVGYFTEAYVEKDPVTGEYREFDARAFVKLSLGKDVTSLNKKETGIKKVTHTPLIAMSRPRQGGKDNDKKDGNKNNNNNN